MITGILRHITFHFHYTHKAMMDIVPEERWNVESASVATAFAKITFQYSHLQISK